MADLSDTILGAYLVIKQVGRGGMATVYKAYHPPTERHVAIKVLPPDMLDDRESRVRFEREARAIASLEHVHILPVFDYGQHEGMSYLVMRYVPTGTLRDRLNAGRLPLDEALRLFRQIAEAVAYAHRHGVLHRDLKPANVLLDDSGNALLSDFGLARLLHTDSSLTGAHLMGTPLYMSPEQGRGEELGPASDVYALGVMLYEMVTGQPPFTGDNPTALIYKHISEPLTPPRSVCPDVPPALEAVIVKALAKRPEDRFPSADGMIAALTAAPDPVPDPVPASNTTHPEDLIRTVRGDPLPPPVGDGSTGLLSTPVPVPARRAPRRHLTRGALALAVPVLLVITGLLLRGVLFNLALNTDDAGAAGLALDGAALFGVKVDQRLSDAVLDAVDAGDTEQALHAARLYADRVSNPDELGGELQTRARAAAAATQAAQTVLCARVLAIVDPARAAVLADEFNDAGVAALAAAPPQESAARIYLDAVHAIDAALNIERSSEAQSASLYNRAQLLEASDPAAAVVAYREAIYLNSSNIPAYYALSSLLLIDLSTEPGALDDAVDIASTGIGHLPPGACTDVPNQTDFEALEQGWLCFLLLTTEAGARLERGDEARLILPLAERAVHLAEATDQFAALEAHLRETNDSPDLRLFTAEAYYYLARLFEGETDNEVLCAIVRNYSEDNDRHIVWANYAVDQLGDYRCPPG